jgi:hypothetical protein
VQKEDARHRELILEYPFPKKVTGVDYRNFLGLSSPSKQLKLPSAKLSPLDAYPPSREKGGKASRQGKNRGWPLVDWLTAWT